VIIAILVTVAVLIVFGRMAGRRGRELREQAKREFAGAEAAPDEAHLTDASGLRPAVADFHVHDTDATVTFDVPLPEGEVDAILAEILVNEAVEVAREKSHTLPIAQVTRVVAMARDRRVGSRDLDQPGVLPPPLGTDHLPQLHKIGFDPIERQFEGEKVDAGFVAPDRGDTDQLGAIGAELRIPKAIEVGLRSQGVDPDTMNAGDLVRTVLSLFGYAIAEGDRASTYVGTKGGAKTYIREDIYEPGGHPELDEKVIDEFMFGFSSSGADHGLLVSDRYAPFVVYERERREPRVRFVSRERLQKFIDGAALG
jgi:hypothetical protein